MSRLALTGRGGELDEVHAMLDPRRDEPRSLVVLGETGTGRSAILGDLRGYALARGWLVLTGVGHAHTAPPAFATLRHLLGPVLVDLLAMEGQEAEDLRAAVGMDLSTHRPEPEDVGVALTELLARQVGPHTGVLVLLDDAEWADAATMTSLAVAARQASRFPFCAVYAASGEVPPASLGGDVKQLSLAPLSRAEAGALLDAQPFATRGRVRAAVITQAAGNPLALTELSRAAADDLYADHSPPGLPLPLTERLHAVFAPRLRTLSRRTWNALLFIAASDIGDMVDVAPFDDAVESFDLDPAVLAPAEELGLVRVTADGAQFRHPLARSAVYSSASFASRSRAHEAWAAVLTHAPDRQAWHLGAAASRRDETVAARLATTATLARQRSGPPAAALALERAADLTPDAGTRATRLIAAAEAASDGGHLEWTLDLATRALATPDAQGSSSRARLLLGLAQAGTGRPRDALETVLPLARQTASDSRVAWDALTIAGAACYQTGDRRDRQRLADTMALLPTPTDEVTKAQRQLITAVIGHADAMIASPVCVTSSTSSQELATMSAAAWLLDRTIDAVELLESARKTAGDTPVQSVAGDPLCALGWAYVDGGRWQEALDIAVPFDHATDASSVTTTGSMIVATVEAARGQSEQARLHIAAALAARTEHSGLLTARAKHALGLCALSEQNYQAAFEQLRGLFDSDGLPRHHPVSYLAIGDLAVAAARAGLRLDGRQMITRIAAVRESAEVRDSERLRRLMDRATSALADPDSPNAYRDTMALGRAADLDWPFEGALFRLEAGEWLRRRRRINEAKSVLQVALDTFRDLRASAWEQRAEAELRACGVAVPGALAGGQRLRELTPQQQRIVGFAAQGLSNREIAQRLFLSPKTVASHLYASYPLLGVARRQQLRLLFDELHLRPLTAQSPDGGRR